MCTLFANLYVLLTWGPHMVYMGTPYIFYIYMIRCGWLGQNKTCELKPAGICVTCITSVIEDLPQLSSTFQQRIIKLLASFPPARNRACSEKRISSRDFPQQCLPGISLREFMGRGCTRTQSGSYICLSLRRYWISDEPSTLLTVNVLNTVPHYFERVNGTYIF